MHSGDWDQETRQHPAMEFMERYTRETVDVRNWDESADKHHTKDFRLIKSTGQTVEGRDQAWSTLGKEVYAPFKAHRHHPTFIICWDEDDGYSMFGIANLWWTLAAPGDEKKVKDEQGQEWDGVTPAAFKFRYEKEGGEVKLAETRIFDDPSQAIVTMLKRGMIKSEDLMNM